MPSLVQDLSQQLDAIQDQKTWESALASFERYRASKAKNPDDSLVRHARGRLAIWPMRLNGSAAADFFCAVEPKVGDNELLLETLVGITGFTEQARSLAMFIVSATLFQRKTKLELLGMGDRISLDFAEKIADPFGHPTFRPAALAAAKLAKFEYEQSQK